VNEVSKTRRRLGLFDETLPGTWSWRYTYPNMNKKWLRIALFALISFGPIGSTWAQVHCLSMMTAAKSTCCCPTNSKSDHCPMPTKKTDDCPMLKEAPNPSAVLPTATVSPEIVLVSFGTIVEDHALKPDFTYERADATFQSFHIGYLQKVVPQFRAPPASPIAA